MQNLRVNDLDCKLRQKNANCKIIHGKKTLVQCKIVFSFQLSALSGRLSSIESYIKQAGTRFQDARPIVRISNSLELHLRDYHAPVSTRLIRAVTSSMSTIPSASPLQLACSGK